MQIANVEVFYTKQDAQLMTTSLMVRPDEIYLAKLYKPSMIWPLTFGLCLRNNSKRVLIDGRLQY